MVRGFRWHACARNVVSESERGKVDGMSARKILLILGGALLACLVICVVLGFVTVRGIRTGIENSLEDGVGTVVAERIGAAGAGAPGTYVINEQDILGQIEQQLEDDGANIDNLVVRIHPGNLIEIGFDSEGQGVTYEGTLSAVNGELRVDGMEASSSVLNFLVPGGRVATGIENGVNGYLLANNLTLASVSSEPGALTLVVERGDTSS